MISFDRVVMSNRNLGVREGRQHWGREAALGTGDAASAANAEILWQWCVLIWGTQLYRSCSATDNFEQQKEIEKERESGCL